MTGRDGVVVFDHAYHGRTNLTMALTAKNMPYRNRFGPFAPEVYRVAMSYPYRDPEGMTGEEAAARAIEQIERQVGVDNAACVLIEPIQGEGGFIVPAPGFLPAVAAWCRANGVLFVADEIQTGFCRTGDWFACDHEGVVPDLITTAKAMAGGMPLAAVTGRAELMDDVHVGGLGGTYGGNPVSCASALASIETMVDQDLAGAARRIGATVTERFTRHAGRPPGHRRRPRPGGHAGHGAGAARHPRARRRRRQAHRGRLPPRRAWSPCRAAASATSSACCPRWSSTPELLDDGLGVLADAVTAEL